MIHNGHFLSVTDRDIVVALGVVIQRGNVVNLEIISRYRNEIINYTLHILGVPPGREGEACWLIEDVNRCFDDLMMDLRAGRASLRNIMQSPVRQQQWHSTIRSKM